jgi:hypothetical protein
MKSTNNILYTPFFMKEKDMNKKPLLLLSLLAYTALPQADLQASSCRLRKIATNVGFFMGVVAAGYGTTIAIVGNNNKALPVPKNESNLPEEAQKDRAARRAHPYNHAFHELNGILAEDCRNFSSKIKDAYTYLSTAASKSWKTAEGTFKPAATPSETTETITGKNE